MLKQKALQSFITPATLHPKSQHHIPAGLNCHVQFTGYINHMFEHDPVQPVRSGRCNVPQVHQSASVKVHPVSQLSPPFQPPGHVNCKHTTQITCQSLTDITLDCLLLWCSVLWSTWLINELQSNMAKLVVIMKRNKSQQAMEGASEMSVLQ